jgi:8-amino-7-oxononanoate synthase
VSQKINQLQLLHEEQLFEIPIKKVSSGSVTTNSGEVLHDFVTTGYLGIDRHPMLIQRGVEYAQNWGCISNWSRMELDPEIYRVLEARIASWMNCSNVILGHTITVNNFSVLPYLAADGYIIHDSLLHTVVFEACRLARDHGSQLIKFKHQDLEDLERILKSLPSNKVKIIAVDGVYSISTHIVPLQEIVQLCEKYNAYCYIDDAHGLGIYGEGGTNSEWGIKGNGVWNYFNVNKDRLFYVSNFGKAFGATCAFLCYPDAYKKELKSNCLQYLFSAPPNPFSIGSSVGALEWNAVHGEQVRIELKQKVQYFIRGLRSRGQIVENINDHPVVFVKFGEFAKLQTAAKFLRTRGIVGGYRAYPVVQPDQCGIRFSITHEHTQSVIDHVIDSIACIHYA